MELTSFKRSAGIVPSAVFASLNSQNKMNQPIKRRTFLTGAAGAAASLGAGSRHADADTGNKPTLPGRGLRAAVLEFKDRWTKQSTGLDKLLRESGFKVIELDLDRAADKQPGGVDLIAFGSFTNNGDDYKQYVDQHGASLRRFTKGGGVVLEMTQSDQFGNTIDYLPKGVGIKRGDRDLSVAYVIDRDHPILNSWLGKDTAKLDKSTLDRDDVNWESVDAWEGLSVLLASEQNGGSPCLLEAAHGRGRFLVSGLWVDKCFDPSGRRVVSDRALDQSTAFFAAIAGYVALVKRGKAPDVEPTPMPAEPPTGPMVGHVDTEWARVLFRPNKSMQKHQEWVCTVEDSEGTPMPFNSAIDPDHDFTSVVDITGLKPDQHYKFSIEPKGQRTDNALTGSFKTPPSDERPAKITLGMGSCAPSDPSHIWTRVIKEGCEGFIFLGDTPYVDTSDLGVARTKHRRFLVQPEIAEMIKAMPCWGTWDDHDFGKNDGHGDFPGKHACRAAFTEYRANATFGHDAKGEPADRPLRRRAGHLHLVPLRADGVVPARPALVQPDREELGRPERADMSWQAAVGLVQSEALQKSDATFKCIATGMIWDDKKNSEKDDWGTYHYERDAIFDLIKDEKIPGCFLLGGDIHVSRALNYGPRVGYDLWQFIVSPMHGRVIPSLNVPHPSLVHDAVEPYVFLKIQADTTVEPATLTATWINRDGKRIFEVKTDITKLRA